MNRFAAVQTLQTARFLAFLFARCSMHVSPAELSG